MRKSRKRVSRKRVSRKRENVKRVSRKRVSRKRVSRKRTSKKLKYSAGRRSGKGGHSGSRLLSRNPIGRSREHSGLQLLSRDPIEFRDFSNPNYPCRGQQGGHSGRLSTRDYTGAPRRRYKSDFIPFHEDQPRWSAPRFIDQWGKTHLTLPEMEAHTTRIFKQEMQDKITSTLGYHTERAHKVIEKAIELGITNGLTITETIIYLTPFVRCDEVLWGEPTRLLTGDKIINIKHGPYLEILNDWVKDLINETVPTGRPDASRTTEIGDKDFIKSIFIKYNNGYGKITTSNAKKAILNMVNHKLLRNPDTFAKFLFTLTKIPKPTLTLYQFTDFIYSNKLEDLFKPGPGMGIQTIFSGLFPLTLPSGLTVPGRLERIPDEDIRWYKDKIFSCYKNIIENKLKKLDWQICKGKIQMLGWVAFILAAKRMIDPDHAWFSMTTHLGNCYSDHPTDFPLIEGWTWHQTAVAMELDILSDENYTPCKEIHDSAYLRDPNWIETEAHLLGMDPETLRSRLLLSSS